MTLGNVRDLLLPGLCAMYRQLPIDADFQIDGVNDVLWVNANRTDCLRHAVGVITRADIESENYKTLFWPMLVKMREGLMADTKTELLVFHGERPISRLNEAYT